MPSYSGTDNRPDRIKAVGGVVAVHAALAAVIFTGLNVHLVSQAVERLQTFDIIEPPPPQPPPPAPAREEKTVELEEGSAGKKAEPSPIVAPKPRIPLQSPLPAAPVAGIGSATSSGAATSGTGTGAGGTGAGRGGGGDGIAVNPRLISGAPKRSDYRRLGVWISGPTRALLRLTISPDGRISECAVVASTGYPNLDARLCPTLAPPMRWAPARDRSGRPMTSWTVYGVRLTPE